MGSLKILDSKNVSVEDQFQILFKSKHGTEHTVNALDIQKSQSLIQSIPKFLSLDI